ncbi:MAG: DUF541 domain-containing protein [Actinobacteria bacterium]|uniref:Unannotated protein n=1 Tax=freshwater metagenome TaxID=449393 RepID=A0A6J7GTT8_9ZZZZ|nr:DUF541 domain-containing protein [Actinomycetota bacterium]MTB28346.1 DUF541 domain-containing protein [Actinomycetota bacterium]
MRLRIPTLAAAGSLVGAVLLLSGCSVTNATSSDVSGTVAITATGTAQAAPDAARASMTIVATDANSAAGAQKMAAASTAKVLAALSSAGIPASDIRTETISVSPTYTYSQNTQKVSGYQASQTLTVKFTDLAGAGAVLDASVAAGGNDVRIDSFTTYISDPAKATAAAREQAATIARDQAEQNAELLGFTLGDVAAVTESSGSNQPPVAMAAATDSAKGTTPISPGTTEVSVTLNVSWFINN